MKITMEDFEFMNKETLAANSEGTSWENSIVKQKNMRKVTDQNH